MKTSRLQPFSPKEGRWEQGQKDIGNDSGNNARVIRPFSLSQSIAMRSNPFSTRFIQPGAIEYQRFDGGTVMELARQFLERPSIRLSIIGPHGSGKSTLVASLVSEFQHLRPETRIHALRFSTDQNPRTPLLASMAKWSSASIVILDGFEQLGFWSRMRTCRHAARSAIKLLVTAHQRLRGFDTLWETTVTETSSSWVVQQLLQQSEHPNVAQDLLISDAWSSSRTKHRQNLRESLFDMYDWYQNRNKT